MRGRGGAVRARGPADRERRLRSGQAREAGRAGLWAIRAGDRDGPDSPSDQPQRALRGANPAPRGPSRPARNRQPRTARRLPGHSARRPRRGYSRPGERGASRVPRRPSGGLPGLLVKAPVEDEALAELALFLGRPRGSAGRHGRGAGGAGRLSGGGDGRQRGGVDRRRLPGPLRSGRFLPLLAESGLRPLGLRSCRSSRRDGSPSAWAPSPTCSGRVGPVDLDRSAVELAAGGRSPGPGRPGQRVQLRRRRGHPPWHMAATRPGPGPGWRSTGPAGPPIAGAASTPGYPGGPGRRLRGPCPLPRWPGQRRGRR